MNLRDKIESIINGLGLSPSKFADEIGVTRPIISHILTERNKPSLEIIQKIVVRFPELGSNWILDEVPVDDAKLEIIARGFLNTSLYAENETKLSTGTNTQKVIDKIVVFYSDKTFETFMN